MAALCLQQFIWSGVCFRAGRAAFVSFKWGMVKKLCFILGVSKSGGVFKVSQVLTRFDFFLSGPHRKIK